MNPRRGTTTSAEDDLLTTDADLDDEDDARGFNESDLANSRLWWLKDGTGSRYDCHFKRKMVGWLKLG